MYLVRTTAQLQFSSGSVLNGPVLADVGNGRNPFALLPSMRKVSAQEASCTWKQSESRISCPHTKHLGPKNTGKAQSPALTNRHLHHGVFITTRHTIRRPSPRQVTASKKPCNTHYAILVPRIPLHSMLRLTVMRFPFHRLPVPILGQDALSTSSRFDVTQGLSRTLANLTSSR